MKFITYRVAASRGIVHIHRFALTNRVHGDRALPRLQPATDNVGRPQPVGRRPYQFVSRIASPEVGAIHVKKAARSLAKETDQSWRSSSLRSRFRESQQ